MKSLLKYLKGYKLQTVLAPVFKMSEAVLELFVPVIMAAVIDVGIKNADLAFVRSRCLMLVVLAAVGLAISVTAQYFSAVAASGFAAVLRKQLFIKIQTLSFGRMDQTGVSTMVTRLTSDVNQVQTGVNMVLRLLLRSPLVVIGAMVMSFFINVRMAMIFVVAIPLLALIIYGVMSHNIPRYRNVQSQLDLLLGKTRESLTGVRVVRAFGKEEYLEQEFVTENNKLRSRQVRVGRIAGLLNPVTFVVVNLGIVAILAFGGNLTFGGELTQGEVVALVNYMSQILVELIKFANLIVTLTKSLACANRIADVLSLPGEDEENEAAERETVQETDAVAANETPGIVVEFSHVSFAYAKGAKDALSDISFVAKEGETVGIIGGTGAGKSTLVQLIGGYYMPQQGTVFVNGTATDKKNLFQLRQGIGFVMQQAKLFAGTVRENLLFGKKDADEPALTAALQAAQAYDFVMEKPQGLESAVEQGGRNFSGGQRQRLSIARALVRRPQILILDDSSSALDYATDAALRRSLAAYWRAGEKATVFVVAQRTSAIQYADKILVLDYGQLVGMGTHEELLETCEVYREIYDSQLQKQNGRQKGE